MMDLDKFVSMYVTKRTESMFEFDIKRNEEKLHKKIYGKRFLVIGGAGSIGSSYIKAILPYRPKCLIVVDVNENALAELTRDIRSTKGEIVPEEYVTYPMDYSTAIFEKMFRHYEGFDIVANFAAHKHVRSEKDIYSVEALIKNNVLHLKGLLNLLVEYPPETYFCVSTDKAANPVNIMGASKRLMEDVIFSYSDKFHVKTARFANVAFSNGSLPAGFLARIQKRQPISAPIDVKRYFVSMEESGQICMLACMLGNNRDIFFPKLQEKQMMSFDSIATELLRENGYEVLKCSSEKEAIEKAGQLSSKSSVYPVFYSISDTSGEKAFEEFYTEQEIVDMDRFSSLGVILNKDIINKKAIDEMFLDMEKVFAEINVSKEDLVTLLKRYLPKFEHIERGKTLDSKM